MSGKLLNKSIALILVAIISILISGDKSVIGASITKKEDNNLKFGESNYFEEYESKGIFKLESNPNFYNNTNQTNKFLEESDDTIVCYMNDYPIKKQDIDDNNCVKTHIIKKIVDSENNISKKMRLNKTQSSGLPTKTVTIPNKYNNAIIKYTIVAPRYSQTTKTYYFTRNRGAQYASGLEYKSSNQLVALVAGFIPKVGAVITISFTFSSLFKSSVASNIRSRTDKGKKVKINEASSNYGTFYGVFDWSGRKISVPKNYSNGTITQKLKNLQYK